MIILCIFLWQRIQREIKFFISSLLETPSIGQHFGINSILFFLTKVFIDDALKLKDKKLVIIHGKGKGIIKQAVYEELKANRNVKDYKTDIFNNGMTIVNLK